jgi:hypothetical protein
MIESPLGRVLGPSSLTGAKAVLPGAELSTEAGSKSSPPEKLNTSKEKALSRP